jgi:hypothetical protein
MLFLTTYKTAKIGYIQVLPTPCHLQEYGEGDPRSFQKNNGNMLRNYKEVLGYYLPIYVFDCDLALD